MMDENVIVFLYLISGKNKKVINFLMQKCLVFDADSEPVSFMHFENFRF